MMTRSKRLLRPQLPRRDFARASLCLAAATIGCSTAEQDGESDGESSPLDDRTHVGAVENSDIVLAAIVEGSSVTVYVCGGPQTHSTHTRWFRGMALANDGAFSGSDGDWALSGSIDEESVAGMLLEPDGTARAFAAQAVAADSDAGLYTAVIDGCETGVVVQPSRAQNAVDAFEAQGTWCNAMSEFAQVIILTPLVFTAQGIEVEVDRGDPTLRFFVQRF